MFLVPQCNSTTSNGLFQNAAYIGINVQDILYGVELALYFKTMHALLTRRRERKIHDKFYAVFSSVVILLITVWIATEAYYGEELWVLSKANPGASSLTATVWYLGYGTGAVIALQLMTDALLIYRCRMIWDSSLVIVVPSILWVATFTLGILVAWSSSTQGENFLVGAASKLGLAYYTVTVFLNMILTGAICYRLVRLGRKVRRLGHEYASVYFSVATLIIESMLPYTLAGIVFLVLFGMRNQMLMPFMSVYMMLMCLSSQVLIFRASTRKAWEKDTGKPADSTIKFSPGPGSQCSNEDCESIDDRMLKIVSLPNSDINA